MSERVAVMLCPSLSERPVHFQDCSRPMGCRMTVGYQGFEVEGRKGVLVADGIVCLDCGVDVTRTMWTEWGDPDLVSSILAVWHEFVKAGFPVSGHAPVLPPPRPPSIRGIAP